MKKETIQGRIDRLQRLGAGDEQCAECLKMGGVHDFEVCERCIRSRRQLMLTMLQFRIDHEQQY